jgi:hypothetical protein
LKREIERLRALAEDKPESPKPEEKRTDVDNDYLLSPAQEPRKRIKSLAITKHKAEKDKDKKDRRAQTLRNTSSSKLDTGIDEDLTAVLEEKDKKKEKKAKTEKKVRNLLNSNVTFEGKEGKKARVCKKVC